MSARWWIASWAACRTSHRTVPGSLARRVTNRPHASSGTARTSATNPSAAERNPLTTSATFAVL